MPIVITCPSGHRLKVPSKYQGRRIVCPVCGNSIDVPGEATSPTVTPKKKRQAAPPPKSVAPQAPTPKPLPPEPPQIDSPVATPPSSVPESPSTAELVAKVVQSQPEQTVTPSATTDLSESYVQLTETPPIPEPAPLNMPLPDFASPDEVALPELPPPPLLHGEDAIEAASMLDSEEDFFPEIRIKTEKLIEVDSRHLVKSADPAHLRFRSVLFLCIASIAVAVICLIPSIVEQTLARRTGIRSPDTWSYFVMLFATIQVAISIYAIRIPDWCTVWMVAVVATTLAAIYAASLALTMFAGQGHSLVRQLGLLDEVFRYRAQPWCFLTMCILLTLAFCCGKYSVGWYQSDLRLAESQTVSA